MLGFLLLRHGMIPVAVLIFTVLIGIALGILVDYRILLVAFMLLCIVGPGMMAWLYFWYAMKPGYAFNSLPHILEIDSDGEMTAHIRIAKLDDEDKAKSDPDTENSERKEEPEYRIKALPEAGRASLQVWGRGVALVSPEGAIMIPDSAFADTAAFNKFIDEWRAAAEDLSPMR